MTDDKFIKALTEFVSEWVENGENISLGNMYGSQNPTTTVVISNLKAESDENGNCKLSRPEKDK